METIENFYKEHPLAKFSVYTDGQARIILKLGEEILERLSCIQIVDGQLQVDGKDFTEAYEKFWLWVLAAYETTRTMAEYSDCFSGEISNEIAMKKRELARIRVPFAKQQLQGKRKAISGENSISGVSEGDLFFEINNEPISMKKSIEGFNGFICSIGLENIIKDMRDTEK